VHVPNSIGSPSYCGLVSAYVLAGNARKHRTDNVYRVSCNTCHNQDKERSSDARLLYLTFWPIQNYLYP
ncbi:hypothetical protein J5571_10640, partial [Streptococcus suis]|nr:hypothetical protein [Streptococcus suis]